MSQQYNKVGGKESHDGTNAQIFMIGKYASSDVLFDICQFFSTPSIAHLCHV